MPAVRSTSRRDARVDDASAMASRLRLSATRLARRLRQQADIGLSPSQLSALSTIEQHGPLNLGALAEHERVTPPSATKVVAKLEGQRLVRRQADPSDGRVGLVSITSTGDALLAESRQRKTAWLASRIATLDAGQRARLADALDVLEALVGPEVA